MIFFRADGNSQIGSGHIMRCLAIAEEARDIGEKSIFITAADDMSAVIKGKSFNNIVLQSDYRNMESEDIIPLLWEYANPTIIVDSYYVSKPYLEILKRYCEENCGKLVYIDDIKKYAYPCDVLIDYQIHAQVDEYNTIYEGEKKPKLLLGTNYVPLRKEFLLSVNRRVKEKADNIIVTTGGSDPEHMAIELVKVAKNIKKTFHFVIGAVNTDCRLIEEEAKHCNNINIHVNATNISELMQNCDVAISAAGSTLYELCATQTPTVTFVSADNQIPIAEGFSTKGIIYNCGDVRDLGANGLAEKLVKEALLLCENYDKRCLCAEEMKTVVDGYGTNRIIKEIFE